MNECKPLVPGDRGARHCVARRGRVVQIDPMKPKLKLSESKRLKLKCGCTAFKFNLRRYTGGGAPVELSPGDWAVFRRGFQGVWVVHEPITKRYRVYDVDGEPIIA